MELTNNEWYVIERTMDELCSQHHKGFMQYLESINHSSISLKDKKKLSDKLLKDAVEVHDMLKTICAKLQRMREDREKNV